MAIFAPPQGGKLLSPKAFVFGLIVIGAIIFLWLFLYIVDQAEQAVVTRFGKYYTTTGPGLRFKLPFGIDRTYIVNVQNVQTEQFGFRTLRTGISSSYTMDTAMSTMLTGDLNMVDVEWIIQYRVVDPVAWTFNVNERPRTIRDVSRSVINMLVGDRVIMDIMGSQRSTIEALGEEFMNETFRSYGLGIRVIAVKLQNTDPPAGGVQEAFDDVNKAIQDRNRLINEGQQAYNEQIPRTRGEAERLVQVAEGYATERVNRASGDVARFNAIYDEYRLSPDVTRRRPYYEMIEDVFRGDEYTALIDQRFNNFIPFRDLNSGSASIGGR
jgi:membrane protease subunit HflK